MPLTLALPRRAQTISREGFPAIQDHHREHNSGTYQGAHKRMHVCGEGSATLSSAKCRVPEVPEGMSSSRRVGRRAETLHVPR